jgi:hypothetical protein
MNLCRNEEVKDFLLTCEYMSYSNTGAHEEGGDGIVEVECITAMGKSWKAVVDNGRRMCPNVNIHTAAAMN